MARQVARRVALCTVDDRVERHTSPWPHIEKATRARAALAHLEAAGLVARCHSLVAAQEATDAQVLTVHSHAHVEEVERLCEAARERPGDRLLREPDGAGGIYYSAEAACAARIACGCVIRAAATVLEWFAEARADEGEDGGVAHTAFAIVRPPGHHAGADETPGHRAEGFCFFNSVAVAAGVALHSGGAQRICIVDWDVHHGNGTQRLFYDDARVLVISIHRSYDGVRWRYPGPNATNPHCGAIEEVGGAGARGRNVNVAWPEGKGGDADYAAAFELIVLPLLRAFAPNLLLVSAGFDAADGDVQGDMCVTPDGFAALARRLHRQGVPMALALEGGYNAPVTNACCEAVVRALLDADADEGGSSDEPPPPPKRPSRWCEPTLRAVLSAHAPHWPEALGAAAAARIDAYFQRASEAPCAPERASKRQRVAKALSQ